jgi:uncharacterized Rmd1/YagE family protein
LLSFTSLNKKGFELDKEYKYTKKLLKVAIEENGYRNKDIAVKAGLSEKSVAQVSKWRNGRANATERQMTYFISNYEYLLKPKIEHLFYTYAYTNSRYNDDKQEPQYRKITGEVIFKHQLAVQLDSKNKISVCRLVIVTHHNKYYLVEQIRAGMLLPEEVQNAGDEKVIARSSNEEANWVVSASIMSSINLDELITAVKKYCKKLHDGEPSLKKYSSLEIPSQDINALQFSFYQKLMKLNLHSELLPF